MDREFGVSRCKLFRLEWISNEVLLYSTGNYIRSFGVKHDGRHYEKKNVCVYIYIHTHSFSHNVFHHVLPQKTGYSSLCYTVGPHCLSILNGIVCIY